MKMIYYVVDKKGYRIYKFFRGELILEKEFININKSKYKKHIMYRHCKRYLELEYPNYKYIEIKRITEKYYTDSINFVESLLFGSVYFTVFIIVIFIIGLYISM